MVALFRSSVRSHSRDDQDEGHIERLRVWQRQTQDCEPPRRGELLSSRGVFVGSQGLVPDDRLSVARSQLNQGLGGSAAQQAPPCGAESRRRRKR